MLGRDAVQVLRGSLGGSPLGTVQHWAAGMHAGWILLQAWFQAVEEQRIPCTRTLVLTVFPWTGAVPQQPVPCVTSMLQRPACPWTRPEAKVLQEEWPVVVW